MGASTLTDKSTGDQAGSLGRHLTDQWCCPPEAARSDVSVDVIPGPPHRILPVAPTLSVLADSFRQQSVAGPTLALANDVFCGKCHETIARRIAARPKSAAVGRSLCL
jgi:hypothetical protein